MPFIVGLTLVFAVAGFALDNYTTWYALTAFAGQVVETNPITRTGFDFGGLAPTLLGNFFLGVGVCIYIARCHLGSVSTKVLILGLLGLIRWSAGLNNLVMLYSMAGMCGG